MNFSLRDLRVLRGFNSSLCDLRALRGKFLLRASVSQWFSLFVPKFP
jgi:hypothetical protein